jgi:hypothetical protein
MRERNDPIGHIDAWRPTARAAGEQVVIQVRSASGSVADGVL